MHSSLLGTSGDNVLLAGTGIQLLIPFSCEKWLGNLLPQRRALGHPGVAGSEMGL